MEHELFTDLFEGAKSSKHERIEDYSTELLGFMWEVNPLFREGFCAFFSRYFKTVISPNETTFSTQDLVLKPNGQRFEYDIVLEDEKRGLKYIIENKIYSKRNQFIHYLANQDNAREKFLLLIPKYYHLLGDLDKVDKMYIVYWEDLLIYLKSHLSKTTNDSLDLLNMSFFNFLYNMAGLYADPENTPPLRLKKKLDKHLDCPKWKMRDFMRLKRFFPYNSPRGEQYLFSIEIADFFEKKIELVFEDEITPRREDKQEHNWEIHFLNTHRFKEEIIYEEKEPSDKSFFLLSFDLNIGLAEIEKHFLDFIDDFYTKEQANIIISDLNRFLDFVKESIKISGDVGKFREDFVKYYVTVKEETQEN